MKKLSIKFLVITATAVLTVGCGEAARPFDRPINSAPSAPVNLPPQDRIVIDHSGWVNDGSSISWKLEPGTYRLDLTANNDGATVEWVGAPCPATQPMRELTTNCQLPRQGQLIVSNPSVFGLGKNVSVTVRVTQIFN